MRGDLECPLEFGEGSVIGPLLVQPDRTLEVALGIVHVVRPRRRAKDAQETEEAPNNPGAWRHDLAWNHDRRRQL
jgi:hypothetical protein